MSVRVSPLPFIANAGNDFHREHDPIRAVKKFTKVSFEKSKHLWSYGERILLISRNVLNSIARSSPLANTNLPNKIKTVVTHMKLASIIGVPFNLVDLISTTQKIFKSLLINDIEGIGMGTLSFTITAADALDSVTTFVNSLLTVVGNNPIEILTLIGLPTAFVIIGTGTVNRTIQIAKTIHLYKQINPHIFAQKGTTNKELRKTLEKCFGIEKEENLIKLLSEGQMNPTLLKKVEKLKEKQKAIILRSVPKDAMKAFERIFAMLDAENNDPFTDQEITEINQNLNDIRSHLQKKLGVDAVSLLANLITLSALVLLAIGITGPLPFILLAIASLLKLLVAIYQEYKNKQQLLPIK